uniref:Clc-like protein n=1 Tax=Plectus sambesii TaxID=2011161 RepID=A0A914XP75_9BILA
MANSGKAKLVLLGLAALLMVLGVAFSVAAIASPSWQVVHLLEYQSTHYHGLWIDCARTVKKGIANGVDYSNVGERHCTYKFDYSPGMLDNPNARFTSNDPFVDNGPEAENSRHREWQDFQIAYMVVIPVTVICGMIAVFFSFCACAKAAFVLIFTITALIAAMLTFGVVMSFFLISHSAERRFVKGVTGQYEQEMGQAFHFELLSELFFMLSFCCGMIVLKCFMDYSDDSNSQTMARETPKIKQTSSKKLKKEELSLLPVPTYEEAFPNITDASGYLIKDQMRTASRSNTLDSTYQGSQITSTTESQQLIGAETIV